MAFTQISSLESNKLVATNETGDLMSFENGVNGQLLTTNGSGNLEWQTIEIPQASEIFWERTGENTYLKNETDKLGIGTSSPNKSITVRTTKDFATLRLYTYRACS